ncbi:hypothetical protein M422DRAFT_249982 [Sphaerobolus stellatus SS14]|nr:hypothetical protein M422DRAFT_249982 [Sphaerobolus stellatus SS14]
MPLLYDLPNELLREIILQILPIPPRDFDVVPFQFQLRGFPSKDSIPEALRLSRVCILWRDTINDMPRAWSTMVIKPDEAIDIPCLEGIMEKWSTWIPIDILIECHDILQYHIVDLA